MLRVKSTAVGSAFLLCLSIIVLPDQFLFSKTVPISFWTEYFPLPFGAGWFVTFIALLPAMWFTESLFGAIRSSVFGVFFSICVAVPIALFFMGVTLSANNLLSQYLWVSIICFPPLILQIVLRLLFSHYAKKRLSKPW